MTEETNQQPRELRMGKTYRAGERVIDPLSRENRLVFQISPRRISLIEGEDLGQDCINITFYNLASSINGTIPDFVSSKNCFEGEADFLEYISFIQQHGGTA